MSTLTKPDPNRPYMRTEIDKEFSRVKARMHAEAVQRGGGVALYTDCYTGKMLRGGDPYDYEHIRSSEELFMQYRDRYTNEQIAKLVNCPENVAVTLRTINISKGKRRMEDWMAVPGNVERHGVDVKLVGEVLERADYEIKLFKIK
ncbi:hypothetical protein KIH41_17625 [Litoribacter ruber]|uniref:hypothetical protein n=1 Tax=Litoribacter ruber TaxID=702568 RepID=UPI001BDA0932|nr:hypothetical protein [Litoribacter ruber]MBT0813113.1 hypothetical protein [Litoribacter ruber]